MKVKWRPGKSDSGRFINVRKKKRRQVDREFYDTKESGTYTAFIKQLINTVIESAIDKI